MRDFVDSEEYKKIFTFHDSIPGRIISRESSWLEFKESFNWLSRDKYAKSIVAFANNKGGYLVFGVANQPRQLVGLQSDNFETIDEAKITEYLNDIFSLEIEYKKFTIKVENKKIGIFQIQQSAKKPILCTKNDGELRESDIYYRYTARSERIKYPTLNSMLDLIRINERKAWMEHLQKISKVGAMNAAVLDFVNGEIEGQGATLVIDEKLVPKLKFITEGNFQKTGKPVLKLVGDVKPVPVIVNKNSRESAESVNVQVTDDPRALLVRLEERKKFKPGEVAENVWKALKHKMHPDWKFHASAHHVRCWRYYKVRPEGGSPHPEKTNIKYCFYDKTFNQYVYTQEWMDFLVNKLGDISEYNRIMEA